MGLGFWGFESGFYGSEATEDEVSSEFRARGFEVQGIDGVRV